MGDIIYWCLISCGAVMIVAGVGAVTGFEHTNAVLMVLI